MDFLILVGQRKHLPRGEYEALEVIDAHGDEENPDFMTDKRDAAIKSGAFDAVHVLRVRVPPDAVTLARYPAARAVAGVSVMPPAVE